jgi:hydrogenase maturation protease
VTGLVILGLGNLLMADDGVGVHAARALEADPPGGALVRDVGTAVFDAVSWLECATRVIAIDAVDAGQPPGTVVSFDIDVEDAAERPASLHDLDLPALLRSFPPGRRPRVTVVGLQPAVVAPGVELSPVAAQALPHLLRAVRRLAQLQA